MTIPPIKSSLAADSERGGTRLGTTNLLFLLFNPGGFHPFLDSFFFGSCRSLDEIIVYGGA